MSIQLNQQDFDHLTAILASLSQWRTEQGRIDLLDETFAGSPRQRDVTGVRADGAARQSAVRVIGHLAQFGQHAPGRESLFALTDRLLSYIGVGADADFLRSLPDHYRPPAAPATTASERAITPTPQTIVDVLVKRFNLDELRELCFGLGIDHEEIKGETKPPFARELTTYMDRRGRLAELVDAIRRARGSIL